MSKESPLTREHNWFIGEDRTFRFTVADEAGNPIDISGWTFEWVLRDRPWGGQALIAKNTGSGIAIVDAASGICEVSLSDDDTLALGPATYFHTLRRTNDGAETVLSFGDALLQQAATR